MRTFKICTTFASLLAIVACNTDLPDIPDDETGSGGNSASYGGKTGYGGDKATGGYGGQTSPSAGQGGEDGEDIGQGGAAPGGVDGNAGEGGVGEEPVPPLTQPNRGSATTLSPDESFAITVNRDVGSVTLLHLDFSKPGSPAFAETKEISLGVGSEPWQVVIAPDNDTAFVVLRKEQKLVRIRYLQTEPEIDSVAVGSEPTGLALNPSGKVVYVTNWNNGTVSAVDTKTLKVLRTIDLNAALVSGKYLGDITPRPALAHPRSIAISNDADGDDSDEALYITEYYAQPIAPEAPDGSNADVRNVGLVYKVSLYDFKVSLIELSPLGDIGFKDANGEAAGCFPNQLQSVTVNGNYAYVLSVCASPKGPLGVKVTTTTCKAVEDCGSLNLVDPACEIPFGGAANSVCVDVAGVKTTTAPVVSIIDTRTGAEIPNSARNLNAEFDAFFEKLKLPEEKRRYPLFANDMSFVPKTAVGYVSANGIDAVFRVVFDAEKGTLKEVGSSTSPFIDLFTGFAADKRGTNPLGVAAGANGDKFAVVGNDTSRNAQVLDFNTQAVRGGAKEPTVVQTTALPAPKSAEEDVVKGRSFANTGRARWSLGGQGWGSCQSCHSDGLSDNVTWYFARGPRQATSLEGSFASNNPDDQRIFNWTGIFDNVDDFEGNTRDISGGVGAIVDTLSAPPQNSDRIDFVGLKHAGLNGSSDQASDPTNPLGFALPPKLEDWAEITAWMKTIRSPRAPSNLDKKAVARGEELFKVGGACQGCHGGDKWTISTRFYTPGTEVNAKLNTTPFEVPTGFPLALLPALEKKNQTLRFAGGNAAALDQILCAIRPVGTFNVAEAGAGIAELRADMKTVAQGDGNPAGEGRGYNPPSLLGMATGAPYLHAGNARTLEGLFSETFKQHYTALAPNFLEETKDGHVDQQIADLIQYLLFIDETTKTVAIPAAGASGGSLCPDQFE